MGQLALLVGHVFDLQSLSPAVLEHFRGDEMPVCSLLAGKFKCSLRLLICIETGQQGIGGLGHV